MRCFVAIDLPDALKDQLEARQDDLKIGRHVPPENMHITLAFLDEQPLEMLQELNDELEKLRADPFSIQIEGFRTFGASSPRVVYADIADAGPLHALRTSVRRKCHAAGITLPHERFVPHVTVARFGPQVLADEIQRLARFLERNAGFRPWAFEVEEITLYQSIPGRDGPVYEALAAYRLDGRPRLERD